VEELMMDKERERSKMMEREREQRIPKSQVNDSPKCNWGWGHMI